MATITALEIVTDIKNIQPNQAISCEYTAATSGAFGTFANLGKATKAFIDVTTNPTFVDGSFYFVCVGYTPDGKIKLVADRNIQANIAWEALNTAGLCTTVPSEVSIDGNSTNYSMRLIGSSLQNDNTYNGEYDAIILNYDLGGKISKGDSEFWYTSVPSWTLNTPAFADDTRIATNVAQRIQRGGTAPSTITNIVSSTASAICGFRPVLIYDSTPDVFTRGTPGCPLELVNDIKKIKPGQAISCEYISTANTFGTFANLGKAIKSNLSDLAPEMPDGTFYFICVGYTPAGNLKLIADRNIQGKIAWETLNSTGLCTSAGVKINIDAMDGMTMRILHTIADRHVDAENHGEWDEFISYHDLGGIIVPSDSDVWNCLSTKSWTLATLATVDDIGTVAAPSLRIARGSQDKNINPVTMSQSKYDSSSANQYVGFRPVLIYNSTPNIFTRGTPACPLELVSDIKKIKPGQAISCEYSAKAGAFGEFKNLGKATKSNLSDLAPEIADGTFYFICVGYTPAGDLKLVADRNIQGKIEWEMLNNAGLCTSSGLEINIDDIDGMVMRIPHTIVDRHVDAENHGEWDEVISYNNLDGAITPSDNDVWNCLSTKSWTLATLSTVDDIGTAAAPSLRIARGSQDKNVIRMSQSKYDSSSANEYVGFRPVLTVKRESRFLYLKEDNSCYKVVNDVLTKVSEDWSALTDADKQNLFKSGEQSIAKATALKPLQKFKILAYTLGKEERATLKISAVPFDKILFPVGLLPIDSFEGIDKVSIKGKFSGKGKCKVLVTTDLTHYKTLKDGIWQNIDPTNIAAVKSDGIDTQTISSITRSEWDALTTEEVGIGFAYLPMIESISDQCEIDELIMQVDMKGSWDMAMPGTDYTYGYPRNNVLRVKLLTNGDYKINYSQGVIEL